MVPRGVNKATGLDQIHRVLAFSRQIAVFGDSMNDYAMLCGYCVRYGRSLRAQDVPPRSLLLIPSRAFRKKCVEFLEERGVGEIWRRLPKLFSMTIWQYFIPLAQIPFQV